MIKQAFFLTTWDEEEIEGILERFPKLEERVRDSQVIGNVGEQTIFHVITQDMGKESRLVQRVEFLGRDYREVAQKAKAGDTVCKAVIKRIVFTNWEIDNPNYPEEGLERINHRGSLGEWLVAGKPERQSGWQVAHDWAGNALERPGNSDMGE